MLSWPLVPLCSTLCSTMFHRGVSQQGGTEGFQVSSWGGGVECGDGNSKRAGEKGQLFNFRTQLKTRFFISNFERGHNFDLSQPVRCLEKAGMYRTDDIFLPANTKKRNFFSLSGHFFHFFDFFFVAEVIITRDIICVYWSRNQEEGRKERQSRNSKMAWTEKRHS